MKITIIDELAPEPVAMLQALYSRSSESVTQHLKKVEEKGSTKFMESFYVGYGHESIGDCGNTTIFIEGVSILACKAIQDNPLYSGQETSTRYIDFANQRIIDPLKTDISSKVLKEWMNLYEETKLSVYKYLVASKICPNEISSKAWDKSLKARAFDVARGFLPAGVTTQLSWSTNLRQAQDNLMRMKYHPLEEVRNASKEIRNFLVRKYPSSFSHREDPQKDNYLKSYSENFAYLTKIARPVETANFQYELLYLDTAIRDVLKDELKNRPKRAILPRMASSMGRFRFRFSLDYGSYRDLQRHRNAVSPIPLLDTKRGVNQWYLDQLDSSLTHKVNEKLESQSKLLEEIIDVSGKYTAQYYTPLGYDVDCMLECDLIEALYIAELRSSSSVHPSLRKIAQEMGDAILSEFPETAIYMDLSPDHLNAKRGYQDITSVET